MAGMSSSSTLRTLLNKIPRSAFLQSVLCLAGLCLFLTALRSYLVAQEIRAEGPTPREVRSQTASTQFARPKAGAIRVPINVGSAALPITIGVPISEGARLYDPS